MRSFLHGRAGRNVLAGDGDLLRDDADVADRQGLILSPAEALPQLENDARGTNTKLVALTITLH